MNRYPDTESSFLQLMRKSFQLHYLTLQHTILCIIAITVIKTIASFLLIHIRNGYGIDSICMIGFLCSMYFFSAALYSAHHAFIDKPITFKDSIKTTSENALRIYGALISYIAGSVIVIYLMRLIVLASDHLFRGEILLHNFLVILLVAISALFILIFSLVYPLIVLDQKKSILNAFHDSVVLTEKHKLGIVLLFVILGIVYTLVSPATIQEYFLTIYHLNAIYDLLVFCVFIPLFINILLMVMHDAKLQSIDELN